MPKKAKENENEKTKNNKETISIKTTKKAKTTKSTTTSSTKKTTKTATRKKTTTEKATTTKTKIEKAKKTSTATKNKKKTIEPIIEYYDLPYKYNQTIVKILAQTPKKLFVYWEISDEDIEKYKKEFGENFFETTKPILKIFNTTLNYSFEIDINDFANSWYININDSKSDYTIELGRKFINNYNNNNNIHSKNEYIYITSSNKLETPNDHILFNTNQNMVYFKNIKTNITTNKNTTSLFFMKNMGKIYNIYDLYKNLYTEEDLNMTSNPSSGNSSQFK